jgi:hypothetical protein
MKYRPWRSPFVLVGFLVCAIGSAQSVDCGDSQLAEALDRMLRIPGLGEIYVEDGAADGSIVMRPPKYRAARREIVPLLRCETRAAAVLIDHLDDVRLTTARFKGGVYWSKPVSVPLGFVCLDILISLSPFGSPIRDPGTENNDGLGSGVRAEYYFRPDDYQIRGTEYRPKPKVLEVKKNWEKALREGLVQFKYSKWHKGTR